MLLLITHDDSEIRLVRPRLEQETNITNILGGKSDHTSSSIILGHEN